MVQHVGADCFRREVAHGPPAAALGFDSQSMRSNAASRVRNPMLPILQAYHCNMMTDGLWPTALRSRLSQVKVMGFTENPCCYNILDYIILYYIILYYIILCYVILYYIMLYCIMLYCITL